MSWIFKTRNKTVLYTITMIVVMLMTQITAAPTTAFAADNPLKVTVEQVFTASASSTGGMFTYMLKPLEPNNPMPAGSTAEGYTFTIIGNDSKEINISGFTRQGVYRYELYQQIDAETPGYTYDRRVYRIEAHVDAALDAIIIVYNSEEKKADDIVFENSRGVLPTDPDLMADPPVVKTVFNSPSRSSTFTFTLTAQDVSWPMPAGSEGGVKAIRITGSGQSTFGVWSYDKAGTYYYTVSEVNSGESRYTYDKMVYTITDMVTEDDGQLVLSRVVTNNTNKQVTSLAFNNSYRSGGSEGGGTPPVKPDVVTPVNPGGGGSGGGNPGNDIPDDSIPRDGISGGDPGEDIVDDGTPNQGPGVTGPKTGDDMNTDFYLALFALGGVLAIGAMTYLFANRRRKKVRQLI